jgi:hypothetical protein
MVTPDVWTSEIVARRAAAPRPTKAMKAMKGMKGMKASVW